MPVHVVSCYFLIGWAMKCALSCIVDLFTSASLYRDWPDWTCPTGTDWQQCDSTILDSPSGHPSGPEHWPFFHCLHMCAWQCCTLKCLLTHPGVQYCKKCIPTIFLLCTMSQNLLQSWHGSHWQFELWVSGLVNYLQGSWINMVHVLERF